ncbi:M28 family peptidase [Ferrimonas balearica]|uniref:M28 family peptidase n=1 Tax=Ferrimonas balearica TaxID=44012 RepID=UPI001C9923EC|nr:M28 family peptidase [Ferrimonas balearica]MBY5922543.1 M28 family peptidase [Ferrimonas balearica]MBY5995527.1 M28 family peptidase [Ferrimonas balearica]
MRVAVLLFAAALSGCQSQSVPCEVPSPPVPDSLQRDVNALTTPEMAGRKTGSEGARLAADYLVERFSTLGMTPWHGSIRHPFQYGPGWLAKSGENLVVWVPGPPPYRLVMAHYDHLGRKQGQFHPGADDNASGVAVLLALAEQAQQHPPAQGVIFAALDAEENGLYGSKALVQQLTGVELEWVLNLDMVGRPPKDGRAQLWWRHGWQGGEQALNTLQPHLCTEAGRRRMKGQDGIHYDSLHASDHYPFHQASVNWLYLGVPPHRDYHSPNDRAERLDYPFMSRVLAASWALLNRP